jgi:hypothetical protein
MWWHLEMGLLEVIGEVISQMGLVLIKETPKSSLATSALWGHNTKIVIYKPGSGSSSDNKSPDTLI